MACYDGDFVGVVAGEVGIDEYKETRHRTRQREGVGEQSPGAWIGVEDDGQECRTLF